jgi:hypothetical protein
MMAVSPERGAARDRHETRGGMRWTRRLARAWFRRAALTGCERTTGAQDERATAYGEVVWS